MEDGFLSRLPLAPSLARSLAHWRYYRRTETLKTPKIKND